MDFNCECILFLKDNTLIHRCSPFDAEHAAARSMLQDRARCASGAESLPFNQFVLLLLLRRVLVRRARPGKSCLTEKQKR